MKWVHIHIEGVVQGVGFRPLVYKLAHWLNLKGWVCNGVDGVHIEAGGTPEQIEMFLYLLKDDAPPASTITNFWFEEIEPLTVTDFQIIESNPRGVPNLLLTPDLGLCENCRAEIKNNHDRRFQYPFTTCTHCGPRYSIMETLPYDRHTTSMKAFTMCDSCASEYTNPQNRRHYSQTNSCPQCAIEVQVVDNTGTVVADNWSKALPALLKFFEEGKIIAVKGIGGFLLMADATNAQAIQTLRERKHRPTKPFAVMYPNEEVLEKDVELTAQERTTYKSIQSPIVLLPLKENPASGICIDIIAPGLKHLGVMQPYTALFALLMSAWGKPVIATSGNVSGSPIVYDNDHALETLDNIADVWLMNNRVIQISEDDSVVRYNKHHQRIMIRRSRGFTPTYLQKAFTPSSPCVLAMGADLKSTFTIQANGNVYISQFLGDLQSYESQDFYRHALDHLLTMLRVRPQLILVDAHPNYFSTTLGKQLATLWNIPVEEVHHHKAHAWAVLAENKLLDSQEPVLCVVWDGTGYGDDRQAWGGEFFTYQHQQLERIATLSSTPMWQGDKMAQEPRLAALFMCRTFLEETNLRNKFTESEWHYYTKLINTPSTVVTTSMGRLFDAVASLLTLCDYNSYEGEAAMLLEARAVKGKCLSHYAVHWNDADELDGGYLLKQILTDLGERVPAEKIAYKFHAYLAEAIASVVLNKQFTKVALSGGVFQNTLLTDLVQKKLGSTVVAYVHQELSPNDENISFGQLVCSAKRTQKELTEIIHETESVNT
jgi:hydrogenase maturation protein HypF